MKINFREKAQNDINDPVYYMYDDDDCCAVSNRKTFKERCSRFLREKLGKVLNLCRKIQKWGTYGQRIH